jgi:hypothetical protein
MSRLGQGTKFDRTVSYPGIWALMVRIGILVFILPAETRAAGLSVVMNWAQAQGKEIGLPGGVASLFKLSDPKHDWVCRTEAYEGDDNSQHYFSVGMKKKGVVIAYKPGKSTYVLNWLTDETGTLQGTVRIDKTGVHLVPNEPFAGRFRIEEKFWNARLPIAFGGPTNPMVGSWMASDQVVWQFRRFPAGQKQGEMKKGNAAGHYTFEYPGRVRIEVAPEPVVYQVQETTSDDEFALIDPRGKKNDFVRVEE